MACQAQRASQNGSKGHTNRQSWRRVVVTRLERALVDGTASIPGLGLPERSSIVSQASVGSGGADRPEQV